MQLQNERRESYGGAHSPTCGLARDELLASEIM